MNAEDRQAIDALFDRLADTERKFPERDQQAEALIRQGVTRLPSAPYYLAQTVVVQQQALEAAQARIDELERGQRGGLFSGMFGGASNNGRGRQQPRQPEPAGGPWGGGGFLAGAAQTAVGVAGGVVLGNMLAGALFGSGEANAAEDPGAAAQDPGADDLDAGGGDFGGDF